MRWLIGIATCAALPGVAHAQEAQTVIVVTAPGGRIDADEALSVDRNAIAGGPRADLLGALASNVPGISIAEAQGNPWAAAISWRGFSVSALQGTEQGMAVYLDGVRFNQPFGDTLTMDLVPEAALARAEVREPNPVFGRNALGGALLLETASGSDLPGLRGSASADSFGGYGGSISYGGAGGLVVLEALRDDGWRDYSPSRLLRGFGQLAHHASDWGIEATLIAADTHLTGNGVAPIELLAADYDAIFTRPDFSDARYARLTASPYMRIGATGRLTAIAHVQTLQRTSANGDLADFGACDADPSRLCLGDDDDGFFEALRDAVSGAPVAADDTIDDYAVFNRGRERTRGGGIALQFLDERETDAGTRRIALGAGWDRYRTRFDTRAELGELLDDRSVEALGTDLVSEDGGITSVSVRTQVRDLSLFASAELPLRPGIAIEGGFRWSDNRVELVDLIGTDLNGRHRFRRLSPAVELDIEPVENLALSLGFAETSRNPTPAELSCADPDAPCALANFFVADPPLKQVVAKNWHAEAAFSHGPLMLHLGLWRSDTRNDIRHIASEIRGRAYFVNLGQSRRQGVDLSAQWRQGPWEIGADYTLTDARFRSGFTVSSPANPLADDEGEIAVEPGDRLPGTPRHAANARLDYRGAGWQIGARARWRSGQVLFGDEGNDLAMTPDYFVVDLNGEVALTDRLTLSLEARNILDRKYATFGTFSEVDEVELAEAPGASDPRAYAPGMPRRFAIAIKAVF